jgi:Tol biopolymer transport system component
MCIALSSRWLRLIVGMVFCAVVLAVFAQASTKESVRAELIRLQNQSGLTLISFEGAGNYGPVYIVAFASRSLPDMQLLKEGISGVRAITSDGTEIAFERRRRTGQTLSPAESKFAPYRTYLGVIRRDGSDLREYLDLDEPSDLCWSPDGTALALSVKNLTQGKQAPRTLQVLNLGTGSTEEVDAKGYATSQCWSPDGKQIVYQADDTLRVYDTQEKKSRILTNGQNPTWSPDGNWITFLEDNGYYAIRPSGNEKKLLFRKKDALTALWWSPDSRFVAYVSRNRLFEGSWWPPIEQGRLRVKRLDDNAEDWVANLYIEGHVPVFQWFKDMEPNGMLNSSPGSTHCLINAYRTSEISPDPIVR